MYTRSEYLKTVDRAQNISTALSSVIVSNSVTTGQLTSIQGAKTIIDAAITNSDSSLADAVIAAATSFIDHTPFVSTINQAIQQVAPILDAVNVAIQVPTTAVYPNVPQFAETIAEVATFTTEAAALAIEGQTDEIDQIANIALSLASEDAVSTAISLIEGLFFQGNMIFALNRVQGEFLDLILELIHLAVRTVVESQITVNTLDLEENIRLRTLDPPTLLDIIESLPELIFDFVEKLWDSGFVEELVTRLVNSWIMGDVESPSRTIDGSNSTSAIAEAISELTSFPGVAVTAISHTTPDFTTFGGVASPTTPISSESSSGTGDSTTPSEFPDYTVTNVVPNRTIDGSAATIDILANVLGTLIRDVVSKLG